MSKNDKAGDPEEGVAKPAAKKKRTRRTLVRKTRYLALEPRIVFDRALAADIVDKNASVDAAKTDTAPADKTLPAVDWTQTTAGKTAEPPAEHAAYKAPSEKATEADRPDESINLDGARPFTMHELVFIDSSLWGAEQLAQAARPNVEVIMLDA